MSTSGDLTLPPDIAEERTLVAGEPSPSAATTPSRAVKRGETVGRYVVLDVIGRGGMGVVYAAYDPELDRKIALKLLRPDSEGSEGSARLLREAQAMAKLSHPNVITVHDVGTLGEDVFVAMEFVDGLTLDGWRAATKREWKEVLGAFIQAGRGLAAAHHAGLVHRDFKPDNVMIGVDGRVRVMDFGLARPTGSTTGLTEALEGAADIVDTASTASKLLETPMTVTGAVMGTPAYMAPEQHLGHHTDARADQFSFCVALYESLYGTRPFRGGNLASLAFQVVQGKVLDPPRDATAPNSCWRIIQRGLSRLADDRYPDMNALLEQLERDPTSLRKRGLLGFGFLAALGLGAYGLSAAGAATNTCTGGEAKLAGVWDEEARSEVRGVFEASELSFADDAWTRTEVLLDGYVGRYLATYTDACEATQVRGEQSPAMMDRRMACLDVRREELIGLTAALREADAELIAKAPEAVTSLSSLAGCSDLDALTRAVPLPEDARTREIVAQLDLRLARIKGMFEAGQYASAQRLAEEVVEEAVATDYRPVHARALHRLGTLQDASGDSDTASNTLHQAVRIALEVGDDELAGTTSQMLGYVDGYRRAKFDQGESWLEIAQALAERLDDELARIGALTTGALIWRDRGELEKALAAFEQALEWAEGSEHSQAQARVGSIYVNIGETLRQLGRYEEAVAANETALEGTRKRLGDRHPDVGTAFNNLAMAHSDLERWDQTQELLDQALEVRVAAYGREHRDVAGTLANLGTVKVSRNDYPAARELFSEALGILTRTAGREQMFVANILNNLGLVEKATGNGAKAVEYYEEGIAIERKLAETNSGKLAVAEMNLGNAYSSLERMDEALAHTKLAAELAHEGLGDDHPHTGVMHTSLGAVLSKLDRHEEALTEYETARRIIEAALGSEHLFLGYAVQGIGDELVELGRPAEAIEPLEAALKIRSGENINPLELGEATYGLAKALWDSRQDRKRAIELAKTARDAFTRAEQSEGIEAVDKWLAKRG